MRKKILVLANGDIYARRGFFNAVISRTKHLKAICNYDIEVLLLSTFEPWLVRKLRKTIKQTRPEEIEVEGIRMKIDWCRFSLFDYVMNVTLKGGGGYFKKLHNRKLVRNLNGYDFIIAHSSECGELSMIAKERYGIFRNLARIRYSF